MRLVASAGAGFLAAVLWFDLMFDTLVRGEHGADLPTEVLDAIAAYYRRVTTTARPMNRLVAVAMLVTVGALIGETARGDASLWVELPSLFLTGSAIGLAGVHTVPNAVRLGSQRDPAARQTSIARAVYRDHLVCLAAIAATLILQVAFT